MTERHPTPLPVNPWRCPKCNALLAKIALVSGSSIEIKCPRCNTYAVKVAC